MSLLCEKYRASCFADLKGQDIAIARMQNFMKKFPEKKALILSGPPGTGKTALAYSLAIESNSEILELNASDFRDKESIDGIIGQASQQVSFSGKGKVLLLDEVDGISTEDRGGLPELVKLIETTQFPIILTANNIWDKKFSDLRKKAELVELRELSYNLVFNILKSVAEREKINVTNDILMSISLKCKGDVRAALNDLQSINSDTKQENLDSRDKEEKIFDVLKKIFKNLPDYETLSLYGKVNMPLDEVFLWLEENIPLEYKNEELAKAFEALSMADVFRGRIIRQQHWRFLIYQDFLMSAGVSASKSQAKLGFTTYKRPSRILKIWMMKQKNILKRSISVKFAEFCHIGVKRAMHDFPILKNIIKNPANMKELRLTEEEVDYIREI